MGIAKDRREQAGKQASRLNSAGKESRTGGKENAAQGVDGREDEW